MTDYNCPKEGCDYGESEEKTLAAVRSHINAARDHDWEALKHALYERAEDDDVPDDYQGDDEEDGTQDAADVLDDADTAGAEDDGEPDDGTTKDGDMASQEEYQQQYSENGQDTDGGDAVSGGDNETSSTSVLSLPAVSASTVLLVLGALAVLLIAWRLYGGREGYDVTEEEAADSDAETDASTVVDTDAGTGGVYS